MNDTFRAAFPSHDEVLVNQKELSRFGDIEQQLRDIIGIIEAHEIDSIDCDRAGDRHCNCLSSTVNRAKKILAE